MELAAGADAGTLNGQAVLGLPPACGEAGRGPNRFGRKELTRGENRVLLSMGTPEKLACLGAGQINLDRPALLWCRTKARPQSLPPKSLLLKRGVPALIISTRQP